MHNTNDNIEYKQLSLFDSNFQESSIERSSIVIDFNCWEKQKRSAIDNEIIRRAKSW